MYMGEIARLVLCRFNRTVMLFVHVIFDTLFFFFFSFFSPIFVFCYFLVFFSVLSSFSSSSSSSSSSTSRLFDDFIKVSLIFSFSGSSLKGCCSARVPHQRRLNLRYSGLVLLAALRPPMAPHPPKTQSLLPYPKSLIGTNGVPFSPNTFPRSKGKDKNLFSLFMKDMG